MPLSLGSNPHLLFLFFSPISNSKPSIYYLSHPPPSLPATTGLPSDKRNYYDGLIFFIYPTHIHHSTFSFFLFGVKVNFTSLLGDFFDIKEWILLSKTNPKEYMIKKRNHATCICLFTL